MPVFGRVRKVESDPQWGNMQKVQVALNDVMRLLCGVRRRDKLRTEELLRRTEMLSINQMAAQCTLLTTWKIMRGQCPALESLAQIRTSTRATRSQGKGDLLMPMGNRTLTNGFRYQAAKIWNAAPVNVRNAASISTAKKLIKEFVRTLPV